MKKINIFTDGGARGNPGPAAVGFVIYEDNKEIVRQSKYIGEATNNIAEYKAVIYALTYIKQNPHIKSGDENKNQDLIQFFSDSTLIVNQMNGIFKIKEKHLKELFLEVRILEGEIGGNVFYNFIRREKNRVADSLVNQTLDRQISI